MCNSVNNSVTSNASTVMKFLVSSLLSGLVLTVREGFFMSDIVYDILGSILFNWKSKLANGDKLTNWGDTSGPCGKRRTIPWFYVLCRWGTCSKNVRPSLQHTTYSGNMVLHHFRTPLFQEHLNFGHISGIGISLKWFLL